MPVSGYALSTSVVAGNAIDFCLSTDIGGPVNLTIERMNSGIPSTSFTITLVTQAQPAIAAWEGYGWQSNHTFVVPANWPSGLYKLAEGGSAILSFVVGPAVAGQASKVILHISFLTPEAYNPEGGKSLYGFNSGGEDERASKVSLDRPRPPAGSGYNPPGLDAEATLIGWLENEGIAIEYCSSIDLHANPNLLSSYDCLVIAGHDEYWTKEMRDQVEQFIENGGNVVVLSGNTCYRQVRLEQNNRMIIFYKYAGQDPFSDNDRATVAWAEPGPSPAEPATWL